MRAASWSQRLETVPQWVVDTSLVALLPLLALVAFLIGTSTNLAADALAYGLGLVVALVLLVRRRAPRLTGWLAERLAAIPVWAIDVGVAVAAGLLGVYRVAISATPADARPDALAYALAAGMAAALLARRRQPLATLVCVFLLWVAYHSAHYPGGAPAPALWVAMFTAGAAERQRGPLLITAMFVIGSDLAARTRYGDVRLLDSSLDSSTMVLLAALLLGELIHGRRARLRRAERDRQLEAERRVAEERLRIARELHDVMAHTIAVITVQAGVAADLLDRAPDRSGAALAAIRGASREAMAELKATVGVLRQPAGEATGAAPADLAAAPAGQGAALTGQGAAPVNGGVAPAGQGGPPMGQGGPVANPAAAPRGPGAAPPAPAPGLAQLDDLVAMAAGAGLEVDVGVDGTARPLPAAVDLTAYRIVQELLTNVLRQARATAVAVRISYQPDGMVVEIGDNGRGAAAGPDGGGYGLIGMRERAAAVGGGLEAGPAPSGGFTVRAWLPTPRRQG
jgi:signal transduction histidine kinase